MLRVCNDNSEESCKHSAQDVLKMGGDALKEKISSQCDKVCEIWKARIQAKLVEINDTSKILFDNSADQQELQDQKQAQKFLGSMDYEHWSKLTNPRLRGKQIMKIWTTMTQKNNATSNAAKKVLNAISIAMKNHDTYFASVKKARDNNEEERISDAIFMASNVLRNDSTLNERVRNTNNRLRTFGNHVDNINSTLSTMGQTEILGKAFKALESVAQAVDKWRNAYNKDEGTFDPKLLFGGAMDIVKGAADFLPPPYSQVTSSIGQVSH